MIKFNRKTDKVAIIAPASSCKEASIKLQNSIKLLEGQGFSCEYDNEIFKGSSLEYFAADKQTRLSQLKRAIENPQVKIIWAFRGGYGTVEIVFDWLDIKPSGQKILIGFSDITVLHFLFQQHYKMQSIHGSVLSSLLDIEEADMLKHIIAVLSGKAIEIDIIPISKIENTIGIKGLIVGGNLTMVCNMIGTKLHPNTADKILFLEDVNEKGYHVHRHLMHMKNAGLFGMVKAVIFCDFTNTDQNLEPSIDVFCKEHINNIPTFRLSGVGHSKVNYPITVGGNAVIAKNKLIVHNSFELV